MQKFGSKIGLSLLLASAALVGCKDQTEDKASTGWLGYLFPNNEDEPTQGQNAGSNDIEIDWDSLSLNGTMALQAAPCCENGRYLLFHDDYTVSVIDVDGESDTDVQGVYRFDGQTVAVTAEGVVTVYTLPDDIMAQGDR